MELHGALTIDLEDWRCALHPRPDADYRSRPTVDAEYVALSTESILSALDSHGAKATFFVPGDVLVAAPEVVRSVASRGHEVASHSPIHLPPKMIPREVLSEKLDEDIIQIERLTGKRPVGFRAPYLSVSRRDGWLIEMLASKGFSYDSSVAPTWTPYWGIPSAPKHPYRPSVDDIAKCSDRGPIVEIPISVWPTWRCLPGMPIGGGFYMRAWPTPLLFGMLRSCVQSGRKLVLYVHPGNIDHHKAMVSGKTFRDSMSQYAFQSKGATSFTRILSEFRLGAVAEAFRDEIAGVRLD